jgi:hypothetical protein
MPFRENLHYVVPTLSGSNCRKMLQFEPIDIVLEGGSSKVSQFDDDIVIFLANGLDDGYNDGKANVVGSWSRVCYFRLLSFGFDRD